jgi:hypothetical protein
MLRLMSDCSSLPCTLTQKRRWGATQMDSQSCQRLGSDASPCMRPGDPRRKLDIASATQLEKEEPKTVRKAGASEPAGPYGMATLNWIWSALPWVR